LGYLKTSRKSYIVYGLIAVLVHFSFIVPFLLFTLYVFSRKQVVLWFIVAIMSFSANNFLNQYTSTILNFSNIVFKNSSIDQKSKAYLGNEDYIEYRQNRFDTRAWYANPSKY